MLMTLQYEGQEIDIAGAYDAKQFDETTKSWISARADLSSAVTMEVYGETVPMVSKEKLIDYKKKLAREVDLEDVRMLEDAV